ncbi:hypothetical protein L3Y34_016684 [Caenorhabditis briggsae]|nr:hypothetical protein L3Y34_016684 [Caenorhabditis briggsae]
MAEANKAHKQNTDTIKSHIKVIHEAALNFDPKNMGMLAVLANAFKSDTRIGAQIVPAMSEALNTPPDPSQPTFDLSYQRKAVNQFDAFPKEFLDALTSRAKRSLLGQILSVFRSFGTDKLPSPAAFETLARICQSEDYEMAVKDLESLASRSLHISTQERAADIATNNQAKDQCHFLFDFLAYRLPHVHSYGKYTSTTGSLLLYFTASVAPNTPQNHQVYRLLEQALLRRMYWRTFHESVINHSQLFGSSYKENSNNVMLRHLKNPKTFSTPVDQWQFPLNPEIFKMTIYAFMRALKITGQEIPLDGTMHPIHVAGYGWPEKSTTFFPKWALEEIKKTDVKKLAPNYAEILSTTDEAFRMNTLLTGGQYVIRYADDPNPITYHCMLAVIFKQLCSKPEQDLTSEYYQVMEKKSPKDIVVMGNYLVDFIIADVKNNQDCNEQTFKTIAKTAALMCFHFNIHRADRFLLSLIMHPSTDEDAQICIQIANEFLLTPKFQERIKWFYENDVPRKEKDPYEYIKAIVKYHDAFPEFEACQLVPKNDDTGTNVHMPTYYGCLIERLLPILDQYVYVALEQQGYKMSNALLQLVSMFYRYHPMPIHFMYSVLFVSHGKMAGPDAKSFVSAFASQIEECHLTEEFEKYNHQKSSCEELIMELLDRMAASLDFVLTPPTFVAKDWRTAEMSPGAQALYLACIELMASPHSPEKLVNAMINVMQMRPHLRPFNVFNLIALLLTALPSTYADALHEEFIGVFKNGETANLKFEEIVFDNYDSSLLLHLPNRARSINMIAQIYWTQCNMALLNPFANDQVPKLLEHVKTEKDLWYTLRLVMPIIRRFWDSWDFAKTMRALRERFGPLVIMKLIIEKLGSMAESGVEIVHEAPFCDLFYNCKYVFVGDFLRETAITEFAKLPEAMRERLKYYVSQNEPAPPETPEREKTPERKDQQKEQQEVMPNLVPQAHPLHQQQHQQHHQNPQLHHEAQHHPHHPHQQPSMPPPQLIPQHHLQHHQQQLHHQQQQQQHLSQMMPPPQQPLQHLPHHQMDMAPPTPAPMHHQQHQMAMHQQMYPGQMFHHPQGGHMGYGMQHHMQQPHPHHPQMQGQMPSQMQHMMHNMTPQQQQQYAYMMQQQQHHYMQQQQHQQHHHM